MIKNPIFYSFLVFLCYLLMPMQVGEYGFYWSELKRQAEMHLKDEVKPTPGPIVDGCNLCVWGTCTPAINQFPPASASQLTEDVSLLLKEFTSRSFRSINNDVLTSTLTSRSESQRAEVIRGFEVKARFSLANAILDEYSRYRYGVLMAAMATPIDEFYANQLRAIVNQQRTNGNGPDSRDNRIVIVEMFTSLPPCLMRKVIKCYNDKFGKDAFADDVVNAFKGPVSLFSNIPDVINALAKANRDDGVTTSWMAAVADAKMMRLAIVTDTWGKKKETFTRVFTERSIPQLRETIRVYEKLRKKDEDFVSLDEDIESHLESMKEIYGTMAQIIRNQSLYFADVFYEMLNLPKPDNRRFINLIRGRCDIDLDDIKKAYREKYKETLKTKVDSRERDRGAYSLALSKLLT